jgi:hypothetical protein
MLCQDCDETYIRIEVHKRPRKHKLNNCQKYKDILFTCRNCGYLTKNYSKSLMHQKTCQGSMMMESPTSVLEKELDDITKKYNDTVKLLKDANHNIIALENSLKIEKIFKNALSMVIEQHTSFHTSDIIEKLSDGINVYDIEEKDIPVIFHSKHEESIIYINTHSPSPSPSQNKKKPKIVPKKKKERYCAINCIELKDEVDEEEILYKISIVDEEVKEVIQTNFEDIDIDQCKEEMLKTIAQLKDSKNYNKLLLHIKKIRYKMLGWLNIKEYEELILEHINIFTKIFENKKYIKKNIKKIISKNLTNLELRLSKYGNYPHTILDVDDRERLKVALEVHTIFPKYYTPFKRGFKTFHNYNLVLFTVKKCIECNMINRYGHNNLVYISLPNSKESNPYSYYYLEKIENDIRYWKMDCRLEDVAEEMSTILTPFCLSLYKKIYFDMFGDNMYRSDVESIFPIGGNEMDQLAENIMILVNVESCRTLIRDIIKEKATHYPTDNDRINIRTDDTSQKKRFNDYNKEYNENDIISALFTGITTTDIEEFINRFKL